ncbi:peptidoglycan editing factor PgeF [Candidatus Nitrospira bockiana]
MATGLITIPAFRGPYRVGHFFGTRHQRLPVAGAVSQGSELDPVAVVAAKQVHGTDVLLVERPINSAGVLPGTGDALVTNQPGVLLTVRTADCVPVLIHDPGRGVVAAVHAGWRGTLAGIVSKTIQTMRSRFGSECHSLRIAIGPSAGPCCYEVDKAVLGPLSRAYPYWRLLISETGPGRGLLNLKELIRRQVQGEGVEDAHVWMVGLCTICRPSLFYSYRREGVVKETMVSGIMLPRGTARRPVRARARVCAGTRLRDH